MNTRQMKGALTAVAVSACGATAAFAGEEQVIELSEVPADIMEVAEESVVGLRLALDVAGPVDDGSVIDDNLVLVYEDVGEVTLVSANTETETDGTVVYEIQGTAEGGRKVEIDLDPGGDVLEIEIEFEMDDVPGAVRQALAEQVPGFSPEFIEASHSPSMQVIGYEFVGTLDGTSADYEVSADGRTITVADQ